MTRQIPRYLPLAAILVCALWVRGGSAISLFRILSNPDAAPEAPFAVATATRTIGTSDLRHDDILAINGRPFHSMLQYFDAFYNARPGDKVTLVLSQPNGQALERVIAIPSQRRNFQSFEQTPLALALDVLMPLLCIFLGALAVAVRPRDRSAWLLLALMLAFTEQASRDYGGITPFAFIWSSTMSGFMPVAMMMFGFYFPERSAFDRKRPWIKWVLLLICGAPPLFTSAIASLWLYDINAAAGYRWATPTLYSAQMVLGMLAVSMYFINIGLKSGTAESADSRRRLRILNWGSSVSLAPLFLLALTALIRQRDLADVPWFALATALGFLIIFPVTLAYVILVERAMDLRFVVRRSLQYGVARVGLWIARAAFITLAVYYFRMVLNNSEGWTPLKVVEILAGFVVLRNRNAKKASLWLDRRFFREAYNAELVLGELAKEVGGFLEMDPLLEKVASRISETLHVPDIVILLDEGGVYAPRYSTRPGEPMNIAGDSRIAREVRERGAAVEVYFDKPAPWIRSLTAEELQTLDFMRTQVLLPLTGRGHLTGILSLGPKLSEAPYSTTDLRLLQAVASQMSLAVDNSRLVASLAAEAADRERANRELEIAREVQERLFPQNFPQLPGLDCAGYCRPARGVGGDYYDFLQLEDGRIGIAIGDVSGKGIAAALLMASLQASLRGQAVAGLHDLAALMQNVNKLVYDASTSNRYATFFYGELDPATRHLSFVNAGHNAPLIVRGGEVLRLEAGGPVVGLLPMARYGQDECTLCAGDIFVGYTDGISEAQNEQEDEWEEDRFIAAVRQCQHLPAKQMIQGIFREADAFTGAAKQYDDMTLLVVKLG